MATSNKSPAFPVGSNTLNPGMTLRDYFAAKALQGMLASETEDSQYDTKIATERAYRMADAMLRARGA